MFDRGGPIVITMQRVLWIFVLVSLSNAQYTSRCGLENEVGTRLKKTEYEIDGRYTVEWCSKLEDEATEWNYKMDYIDFHNGTKQCPQSDSLLTSISLTRFLTIHSVFMEKLQRPLPNCNITCLSKPLDLLFSGCYLAQNQLSRQNGRRTWHRSVAALRVDNRFASAEDINRIRPFYVIEKDGDTLIVTWNLHYIPVLDYSMAIAHFENKSATQVVNSWKEIQNNCTHDTYSIVCRYRAPRPGHCVATALEHNAPWRRGVLFKDANIMKFCGETDDPLEPQLEPLTENPGASAPGDNNLFAPDDNPRAENEAIDDVQDENAPKATDKYLVPSNCVQIDAPILNDEIKAALNDQLIKRDKAIEARQKLIAKAISALATAITDEINTSTDKNQDLLKKLMDVGRLLCDIQHSESLTRRNFALYSVKKDLKKNLLNTKIDKHLFGDKISDTLKTAKAVCKSGTELKISTANFKKPTPAQQRTQPAKNLNWKPPVPARRQQGPQWSPQRAPPSSSKPSPRPYRATRRQ